MTMVQQWTPKFVGLFKRVADILSEQFRFGQNVDLLLIQVDPIFILPLSVLLRSLYYNVQREVAPRALDAVKADELTIVDPNDLSEMQSWNTVTMGGKISSIADSTRDAIRTVVQDGLDEGLGIDSIARRLRKSFAFSRIRARMIAQTEVIAASNAATHFVIAANLDAEEMTKSWLSAGDRRVRPTHIVAGTTQKNVKMKKPFLVGGSKLMFPGDGSMGALAKEVINCRCAVLYYRGSQVTGGSGGVGRTAPPKPRRRSR